MESGKALTEVSNGNVDKNGDNAAKDGLKTTLLTAKEEKDGENPIDEINDLSELVFAFYEHWAHRKDKLEHAYTISGWYCSVIPEIRTYLEERGTG